jgi:hypothetical protein
MEAVPQAEAPASTRPPANPAATVSEPERQIQHTAPVAADVGRPSIGEEAAPPVAHPDELLGATDPSPQFGILGKVMGRTVALDLNQTHTVSLFGVFVQTPFGPRLLRPSEIERIHGGELRASHNSTAVHVLGQGVLTRVFRNIFEQLAAMMNRSMKWRSGGEAELIQPL